MGSRFCLHMVESGEAQLSKNHLSNEEVVCHNYSEELL